ncbi:hypothetical protein [Burkholderia multivorans]|uniref:hypothetical protein n=1 Tax=Burkholderia multivorans TaxID=87883 RepID=UPI001C229EE8|nr:hypothetical protein [Burkholderia multivorans]MBU9163584.1 hypothetical protein [Burkholderia multivorans]
MADSGGSWLVQLLEQVSKSKKIALVLFLASGIVLFGPIVRPALAVYFDIPSGWRWAPATLFLISALTLVVACIEGIPRAAKFVYVLILCNHRLNKLDNCERYILVACATHSDTGLHLRDLYRAQHYPMAVLDLSAEKLSLRGLIRLNPYDERLLSLTSRGKKLGIKIASQLGDE